MNSRSILSRLKRLESLLKPREPKKDEDGFFKALGIDGEEFNYDAEAALTASAVEDWQAMIDESEVDYDC